MEVTIRPKNFKISPDIEEHIRKRVGRLPRQLGDIESTEVTLSQEPTRLNANRIQYVAQLTLRTRNNLIRSEVTNAELLTAIDQTIDRVGRQIARFKARRSRGKGSPSLGKSSAEMAHFTEEEPSVIEMAAPAEAPAGRNSASPYGEGVSEEEMGDIVRVKQFSVMPMFPEEAIEQMELLGHTFYIFWNASEEKMNVLYRRTDGNYGLLQPDLA